MGQTVTHAIHWRGDMRIIENTRTFLLFSGLMFISHCLHTAGFVNINIILWNPNVRCCSSVLPILIIIKIEAFSVTLDSGNLIHLLKPFFFFAVNIFPPLVYICFSAICPWHTNIYRHLFSCLNWRQDESVRVGRAPQQQRDNFPCYQPINQYVYWECQWSLRSLHSGANTAGMERRHLLHRCRKLARKKNRTFCQLSDGFQFDGVCKCGNVLYLKLEEGPGLR